VPRDSQSKLKRNEVFLFVVVVDGNGRWQQGGHASIYG